MNPGEILPRLDVAHLLREAIKVLSCIKVGADYNRVLHSRMQVQMTKRVDYVVLELLASRNRCLGETFAPTDEHRHRGDVDLRLKTTIGSVFADRS